MAQQLNLDASDLAFCLFSPRFLELRVLSLFTVLACWAVAASRMGKGLVFGQNLFSARRITLSQEAILAGSIDPCKVGRLAWDRAHKDSTRAALVPGRGASTSRGKPSQGQLGGCFQGRLCTAPGVSHFGRCA
eukprot:1160697-Pelagomonas_calceolata.AAC.7